MMTKAGLTYALLLSILWWGCKNKSVQELENSFKADRATLFSNSLNSNQSDSLFFDDTSKQSGQSKQALADIATFYHVDSVLAEMVELPASSSLLQGLSTWSGITPWENKKTDGVAFKHINPLFIAWCVQHAVPDPTSKFNGVSCKALYDQHFSRTVRIYRETYNHLENNDLWGEEVVLYRELIKSESFHPTRYYNDRFRGIFDELEFPLETAVFNPSNGISFWMRREMDGSRKACFKALELIEKRYN